MKTEVELLLKLKLDTDDARKEHGETVLRVLRRLDTEIETARKRANGYPASPISGDVWFSGAGYISLAHALTDHFKAAGWLKREENASALWAKATLAVCSHYRHMVGPAMLANADCLDRLGNAERSSELYAAIAKDFALLLDEWVPEAEAPVEDDRLALESLQTAAERLVARGIVKLDAFDLVAMQSQVRSILSRPVSK